MESATCRDYWKQFGSLRVAEAVGDEKSEVFNQAIGDAYTRATNLAA
ncbi:Peptide transporter permease SapC OS=Streptomyces microflavus OX=1919 GN=Smic_06900 PE=4 SV=1 [Streptomyces microflavus]